MKKIGLALLAVLIFALAGCSSNGSGKAKVEVAVDKAAFVLLGDLGEQTDSEMTSNPLAVTLSVKNISDSTISVSTFSDIKVYDGDKQLNVETSFDTSLGFETSPNDEIGAGKTKNMTILFTAEKDKKYEISVKPFVAGSDKTEKEVVVSLDTTNYADSFDNLDNPAKALTAYIETIFMDKENVDYEKLVTADKSALQEKAITAFEDSLGNAFYNLEFSDEDVEKKYAVYKSAIAQKAKIQAVTSANANGKAIVKLEYASIPLNNLYDKVDDLRDEYLENTGDYDGKKRDEYAFSKLDAIINSIEPKGAERALRIEMIEKDGKWTLNLDDYNSQELMDIFAKGSIH